ncbi:MAG: sugar transferase [Bacteroidales bacterium]|nr:sugar transferase [Bacteroidales bacterium]
MKRLLDIIICFIASLLLAPVWIILPLLIVIDSTGNPFYVQKRVGKDNKDFNLLKFRTMYAGTDKKGLLTVGDNDRRITRIGYFLRKYKLDELPQLFNIIKGDMSIVGPRPEVRKYVQLYNEHQRNVLKVRPGLTDYASIEYIAESELLAQSDDPEYTYIQDIMPKKIELNLKYIENQSLRLDFELIVKTLLKIIGK